MKITFTGAAKGVTGSKHLLEINGKRVLLDCGLFQGKRAEAIKFNLKLPFDAKSIDALILSHAHIDHSGAIPILVKNGFRGPIYCTPATKSLCEIMLRDAAYIQEREVEWLQKKLKDPNAKPLYTIEDAERSLKLFEPIEYHQPFFPLPGLRVQFFDAGHILGSALVDLEIDDDKTKQKIRLGFTGDLGRKNLPILKDREQLRGLDFLITESTYGNKYHDEILDVEDILAKEINEVYEKKGKIIIPAFAVERTQEILFVLRYLRHKEKIPTFPIFIDSPLAVSATNIFSGHPECFDDDMNKLLEQGRDPFLESQGVQFIQSVDESKGLNEFPGPAIIISASGMCEFGRIKHHLANNITNPNNAVLIIGWMAENTLGRKLINGESPVNIFGDPYDVRAKVTIFNAFSGHGDKNALLDFAKEAGDLKNIFCVHGEESEMIPFTENLQKIQQSAEIFIPNPKETFELLPNKEFKLVSTTLDK